MSNKKIQEKLAEASNYANVGFIHALNADKAAEAGREEAKIETEKAIEHFDKAIEILKREVRQSKTT